MRLTLQNLAHYLVDKGFLHPKYPINGQYLVTQQQSRNSIFQIQLGQLSSGLFVKQLNSLDGQNGYLMQKEATANYLIHKTGVLAQLTPFVPEYFGYDPSHHVLVTQYFLQAQSLHEVVMARKTFEGVQVEVLAKILATLHQDLSGHIEHIQSLQFFNRQPPWVLSLGDPNHPLINVSPQFSGPVVQLIHQQPLIAEALEYLRVNWRGKSLIHGDIKLANFIVLPPSEGTQIKLIDWEISDLGDSLWDVAGLVQSLLVSWLTMADSNADLYQQLPGSDSFSQQEIERFIARFWSLYCQYSHDTNLNSVANRHKLMKFSGARMLQTAYETNVHSPALSIQTSRIMQYCQLLLTTPELMAEQLLGVQQDEL